MCSRKDCINSGKMNPARVTNCRKFPSDLGSSWAENSWRLQEFMGEVLHISVLCLAAVVAVEPGILA